MTLNPSYLIPKLLAIIGFSLFITVAFGQAPTPSQLNNQSVQGATEQAVKKVLDQSLKADYTRAGFTIIYLTDPNQRYRQELEAAFKQLQVPTKYDYNPILTNIITRRSGFGLSNNGADIIDLLTINKVPQQITSYLFNEKDGRYNYDRLFERARFGLDDNAVMRLKQSAQGVEGNAKTDAWIMPLIANTYIAVIDVRSVRTWQAYYDEIDNRKRETARRQKRPFNAVRRVKKGYLVDIDAALLKLNLRDSTLYDFFDKYWADANTPANKVKGHIAARNDMKLPIRQELYKSFNFGEGMGQGIGQGLGQGLGQSLSQGFLGNLTDIITPGEAIPLAFQDLLKESVSNIADLKAKQAIYDIRPIRAKLGTKEGLRSDDLYGVYENVQGIDGNTKAVWQGYVRASVGVVDNASNATGSTQPSEFYQISGKKLDAGMVMQEASGFDGSVMLGVGNNGPTSFLIRLEALAHGFGSTNKFWNNSRLYLEGGISGQGFGSDYDKLIAKDNTNTTGAVSTLKTSGTGVTILSIALGASKYFNFWRNVQAGPYVGLRGDYAQFSNEDLHTAAKADFGEIYGLKGITIDAGLRLGITVYQNFRILGSIGLAPYFTNSAFFGVNKPLALGTGTGKRIEFENTAQEANYNALGTTNPYFIKYDWVHYDFGIHFEF